MKRLSLAIALLLLAAAACLAGPPNPTFKKLRLTDKFYAEGAYYGDFNKDGKMDVVAGPVLVRRPRLPEEARDPPAQGIRSQGLFGQLPHLHRRLQRRRLARRALRAVCPARTPTGTRIRRQRRAVEAAPGPHERGQRIARVGRHQRRRPAGTDLQHRRATWATPPTIRPSRTSPGCFIPITPKGDVTQRFTHGIGSATSTATAASTSSRPAAGGSSRLKPNRASRGSSTPSSSPRRRPDAGL